MEDLQRIFPGNICMRMRKDKDSDMDYTIKNQWLQVTIRDYGAELQSITGADGTEYLWTGDPAVWGEKAPNIFPYVARLTDGKYTVDGKIYEMKIHGIVKYCTLLVEQFKEDCITFRLDSDEETKSQYPFDFIYRISYLLEESELKIKISVVNIGQKRMYFALGGHPGFRVPLEDGLAFEDYHLEFSKTARPYRVGFTDTCFVTGCDENYSLLQDRFIPLCHDRFDQDAIVLKHADRQVKLASFKGTKSVTVTYPDFPYLGIWHMPKTQAPYVCIEPWTSLPSRDGIVEEITQQSDLIGLEPGKSYTVEWKIRCD